MTLDEHRSSFTYKLRLTFFQKQGVVDKRKGYWIIGARWGLQQLNSTGDGKKTTNITRHLPDYRKIVSSGRKLNDHLRLSVSTLGWTERRQTNNF